DVARFALHFVEQANTRLGRQVTGVEEAAMKAVMDHVWSGNLRELGTVVRRAVVLSTGSTLTADCLPAVLLAGHAASPPGDAAAPTAEGLRNVAHQAERSAILAALERNGYNKSRTAEQLNIDRETLSNKLQGFGIEV